MINTTDILKRIEQDGSIDLIDDQENLLQIFFSPGPGWRSPWLVLKNCAAVNSFKTKKTAAKFIARLLEDGFKPENDL